MHVLTGSVRIFIVIRTAAAPSPTKRVWNAPPPQPPPAKQYDVSVFDASAISSTI